MSQGNPSLLSPLKQIYALFCPYDSHTSLYNAGGGGPGGARPSEISYIYDPPIYDITSGCRVAALFSREAPRWTPDAIWFSRYFNPQANGIMYLECREC